jgi:hypothetical protein
MDGTIDFETNDIPSSKISDIIQIGWGKVKLFKLHFNGISVIYARGIGAFKRLDRLEKPKHRRLNRRIYTPVESLFSLAHYT